MTIVFPYIWTMSAVTIPNTPRSFSVAGRYNSESQLSRIVRLPVTS
ncbi:MAG: hypothetical protein V4550_21205 [Gemmatimonadota bacterium]